MRVWKGTTAALLWGVAVGLLGCAQQSVEDRARIDQRLAGLRIDTIDGLRVVCLQAPPAGCPSTTVHPSIIARTDFTTHVATTDKGPSAAQFTDNGALVNRRAHVFTSSFSNNRDIEVLVNAEENPDVQQARQKAIAISGDLGRMPACLLKELKQVRIQDTSGRTLERGGIAAAASSQLAAVFIYEDVFRASAEGNRAEEILLHELAHILFDNPTSGYSTAAYKNAVAADGVYISRYAAGILATRGNQADREDVAESFVAYYGAQFRANRVGAFFANSVRAAIPNRIAYFDKACPNIT